FVALRSGLHLVFVGLTGLVIARAVVAPTATSGLVIGLSFVLLGVYGAGALVAKRGRDRGRAGGIVWLALLVILWAALLWLTPEAAYLVFPLFFLDLHLLGRRWGSVAIIAMTALAIVTLGL